MDNLDHPAPSAQDPALLEAEITSLRSLINTLLILLLIVSGTLSLFLFTQYKLVHRELQSLRPHFAETMDHYAQMKGKMDDFEARIRDFARTHPDFAATLNKIGGRPVASAPAPASAAGAPPPVQKKK